MTALPVLTSGALANGRSTTGEEDGSWARITCARYGQRGYTPLRCIVVHMARTNIDIDDELVDRVMVRYGLRTKREAVDYALRHLAGQPMTREEMLAMAGSMPGFAVPDDPSDIDDPS